MILSLVGSFFEINLVLIIKLYVKINHEIACSSQKNGSLLGSTKASFLSGRKLKVNSFTAPVGARSSTTVCAVAEPDRPLWFPGSTPPPWLDGSLPGDFGFDPLGLGK